MSKINLTRRTFLGGVLAVVGAAAINKALPRDINVPRIWSDGIHDDLPGLQAAIDGKPFVCDDMLVVRAESDEIIINGGNFFLGRGTLYLNKGKRVIMTECILTGESDSHLTTPRIFVNNTDSSMNNMIFIKAITTK